MAVPAMKPAQDRSPIVVISWWSNALGLACLHQLVSVIRDHPLLVIQVGKTAQQRERFRRFLPDQVAELFYPDEAPADHSRVLEEIVCRQLAHLRGLWIFDHDVFIFEDGDAWLLAAEGWFEQRGAFLALPVTAPHSLAITNPAFWLSPMQLPAVPSFFDPVPFQPQKEHQRPDLYLSGASLLLPEKDTLVQARDFLASQGRLATYPLCHRDAADHPLPAFPTYEHLGGLSLFTLHPDSPLPASWVNSTVKKFARFFSTCLPEWIEIEEPQLLERLRMYQHHLETQADDLYPFANFPRGTLNIGVPRKKILSAMLDEVLVFSGKQQGGNAQVLPDLGNYADDRLAQVRPVVVPGSSIAVEDEMVYATPPGTGQRVRLFSTCSPALSVFNHFNGTDTLAEAAFSLQQDYAWPATRAFAYARGVFLALVVIGFVVPKEQV